MHRLFDLVVLGTVAFAQWRIARAILRAGRERYSHRVMRWLQIFVAVFLVYVVAGALLSVLGLVSLVGIGARPATFIGGAACVWLLGSTAAWVLGYALQLAKPQPFDPARRRLVNAAGGALIASPFVVAGYGALVQRTDFRIREVEIPLRDLPDDLNGLRILQLSDIHLSDFLSESELARVIDLSNETNPHLALVTGDLITGRGDPLDACLRQLARLRSEAGILGCLGNHEIYARAERYATEQGARAGIRFLRMRAQALEFGNAVVNCAGVDYQPISRRKRYLEGAEGLLLPGAFNVLLSHNPDVFPVAAAKGFDLTVAGHTHGGQVTMEILEQSINPARFFTPYVYGRYQLGKACAYVTRGIGTIGIPARIGAPPEVTLLRLRKASA